MTKRFFRPRVIVTVVLSVSATAILSVAFAEGAAGVSARPVVSAHPRERDLAPAGLQYYWKRELTLAGGERAVKMYLKDENLYLVTNDDCLRAVDAAVGNPKWFVRVGNHHERIFEPTHVPDMRLPERIGGVDDISTPKTEADFDTFDAALVNSMTHLMVVDRKTGRIYRDVRFDGLVADDAGVSDGTSFYVGTGERNYCAMKLLPNVVVWKEHLGQNVSTPMAYYERRIFMGTLDGLFRCADVDNYGKKRWERTFDGSITEKCLVNARGLFLACNDHRIYAFYPHDGKTLWPAVVVKGAVGGPMQMGEKTLFQYIRRDGLYAINVTNGDVRWKLPAGRRVLAILDGVVYVLDAKKNLRLVNEITGKTSVVVPLGGFDFYADNTTAPAIYTATRAGQVFCLRPAKAGRLTAEMLTK
ncbi:MAG: PQQ-binding-like beta-propeller repeat protein [Phycisphaerae bacterium]|nr:PQQ-binding-like beta-propeller repeat protein [Phycisphaerae bacterium]